ncbi:hypothetical protein Tco_0735337 [Tanacetum coccineum]
MTPRSCLRWKPTGRVFKNVVLRWVPTGKTFASSTTKVDSEPPNGSNADITNQCESEQALDVSADISENRASRNFDLMIIKWRLLKITLQAPPRSSMFKRRLIAADQASVFMAMTSDHNRSELGIHDHSNEPSSSKLVPKVVPLAVKTATSRQELELLFHHHIAMLRTTEHPSDTYVFTMKMEILLESASNKLLVAFKMRHSMRMLVKDSRSQDGIDVKDNVKGSKVKIAKHEGTSLQQRTKRKTKTT